MLVDTNSEVMKFIGAVILVLLQMASFVTSSRVTSGQEFQGGKIRRFPETNKVLFDRKINSATLQSSVANCTKWGVITTIFQPSEALQRFTFRTDWCLVIVADVLTPKVNILKNAIIHIATSQILLSGTNEVRAKREPSKCNIL